MADYHFRKWRTWLERIETDQLQDILINHYIFEGFREVVKPLKGSTHRAELAAWIAQGQIAFACTAIRRATEKENGRWKIISLRRLLDDMALNSNLLTRVRYKQLYTGSLAAKFADRDYDRLAGRGSSEFPRSKLDADIRQVES